MTTRELKARLDKLEASLTPPVLIEVDEATLPDDYAPTQVPARYAVAGARAGSRTIFLDLD